jgi:hypothetical protein
MTLTAKSTASFLNWQAEYAERRIATFPVEIIPADDGVIKKPMVTNYPRFGRPASAEIARRYPDAVAIGLMAGKRSGIAVNDIDTTDERVLADRLNIHGQTPIIIKTASGKFQAWYRHNGEGRHIRPFGKHIPVDILGGGFVVAPPSKGPRGDYQFIQGNLDDIGNLPVMRNIDVQKIKSSPAISLELPEEKHVPDGKRHKELLRYCMKSARYCDDFDALLDVAKTRNDGYEPPMTDTDVVKIAKWAWDHTEVGQNWFDNPGGLVSTAEYKAMIGSNNDAVLLLGFLRSMNGAQSTFMVANGLADIFGWPPERLAKARRCLEASHLDMVRKYNPKTGPSLYRWRKIGSRFAPEPAKEFTIDGVLKGKHKRGDKRENGIS